MSATESSPSMTALTVRSGSAQDLDAVVRIAIDGMPWAPMMQLGPPFVRQIYGHAMSSRHSFLHVAELDGRVVGFVLGATDSRRWFRDFLLRRGILSAFVLLPRLLRRVHRQAIWRGLTYFPEAAGDDPPAECLGCVIVPELKGQGVAVALLESMCSFYRERGIELVKFGDIDVRNTASNRFFGGKATFVRTESVYGGNQVNVYHFRVPPGSASAV